jgi:bleomycin hydrolase
MNDREITRELVDANSQEFSHSGRALVAEGIISSGIDAAARRHEAVSRMEPIFSNELNTMDITNQKKSGRCWIFAGMNVMRYALAKKLKLRDADFELSQSYMMFWDKLEKANYFLESVIDTAGEDKDGRTVMWLFSTLLGDGGQWDMLVSLIEKYGMAPKYAMRESFHSSNSARMNALLKRKLRRDGVILRGDA